VRLSLLHWNMKSPSPSSSQRSIDIHHNNSTEYQYVMYWQSILFTEENLSRFDMSSNHLELLLKPMEDGTSTKGLR
jgi:hypothetical protein